ncbi:MAG: glycosyl hydrolase 115 family protein, partial [candidate division KSB1 bacterium]|nr:glycosyl hydrolase 115 family protein [candidate division KSB1 bacterium]
MTHRNNKKLLPSTIQLWLTILLVSLLLGIALIRPKPASAKDPETFFSTEKLAGAFALSDAGKPAVLCASSQDYPGVLRVLRHFQADIERVTGTKPAISFDDIPEANEIVIIGTLGKSQLIDKLVSDNKLDVSDIVGRWEASLIQVIEHPFSIGTSALVIVGSDKRGTIFGMFDLSEKIGVSPWYWWADVPPKKKTDIYILPGRHILGPPKVKYRGIFINDEAPALSGWAYEKFGGFNAKFYEHVFELILRLKGNFLWPAMWGRAFYDDDPENPRLADEYGVVIGTSHHEPMMRAHDEWRRYGSGPWNYEKNEAKLRQFWTEGIRRMGNYESIVTLAMRGDGDEPMSEEANIELLQRIVKDQREILKEVTGKDITTIPQVWALYKEVQEYYDKGMRVPDDVTLLLCDDNWGNIRKLPKLDDPPRAGGYGIYYHYDYVGGPRNFKWLNTNQISRVWEQMHLAYEYDARQIWIVNVGDIKPMEFPISFFLDYAWNPEIFPAEYLPEYTRLWSEKQFGLRYAKEIAHILTSYTKFNSRRKPELLSPDTYSLVNYREAETVVSDYKKLEEQARTVYDALPAEYQDAFYQLVLHPVEACANLNELYVTVGKNRLYAKQGRAATNSLAEKAKQLFARDAEITNYYNKIMANGKWNHMMDQT